METIPRPEYPRPQLVRKDWMNLNGKWSFTLDLSNSGIDKKKYNETIDDRIIIVPFCPESKLSGIEFKDFMPAVWYQRKIVIASEWKKKRIKLHFGAVDYHATVWINGIEVGQHKGGYTPFCFDITDNLNKDENILTLCAKDDIRNGKQPRGKQSSNFYSQGCDYSRTTGIWQTVWLEAVDEICIDNLKFTPLVNECAVEVEIVTSNAADSASIEVLFNNRQMAKKEVTFDGCRSISIINLKESHLWSAGQGNLYDINIEIKDDGKVTDSVQSYFGLRSVTWDKKGIKINDEYIFQRLVLDQGFYPDGIYTAPTDYDLKKDIQLSMDMGFNGARLTEKIFEPRYLYHADKMGYLCWGEHGNWGLDITTTDALKHFLPEWMEAVNRDYNHPSIVGWCPFNETWDRPRDCQNANIAIPQEDDVLRFVYYVTKEMDKTRPVIDTSGNYHVITDIFDVHNYNQNAEKFADLFKGLENGDVYNPYPERQKYDGQPYFVSEYGGIWWAPENTNNGWGYGGEAMRPKKSEDFINRYKELTEILLKNDHICAFCYTQLYDIEQEVNGLYTYDRKAKFNPEKISDINTQAASIEKDLQKNI